ncbi:MAG: hypothetical protein OEW26_06915 [Nitrospirota bacterium]|nr:hypothetical protein [Nitrospirota bacterium]
MPKLTMPQLSQILRFSQDDRQRESIPIAVCPTCVIGHPFFFISEESWLPTLRETIALAR